MSFKLIFLVLFFFIGRSLSVYAGNSVEEGYHLKIKENSFTSLKFSVELDAIDKMEFSELVSVKGYFAKLSIPSFGNSNEIGCPQLPVIRKLIEIPLNADISVNVKKKDVLNIDLSSHKINLPLFPAQPSVSKNKSKVDTSFYFESKIYANDVFYAPGTGIVEIETLGVMRGTRMARVNIYPFQYNPVKGSVKVFNSLDISISFINPDINATKELKSKTATPYLFINDEYLINKKSGPSGGVIGGNVPVKYVIVSKPMFKSTLQPFVQWKIAKGFEVIEAYTDNPDVGSSTNDIKSYLKELYDSATTESPAPTFVLIVGDFEQLPAFTGQTDVHATDLFFCEYTGDYFPEAFYGRFSAVNTAQLKSQIDKTIEYERYEMNDPSFLNHAILIAGDDSDYGPVHGNGQLDYLESEYINSEHNFIVHSYYYPESVSKDAEIIADFNNGAGIVNYTAHGLVSGWLDPSFRVSDVSNLTNQGKYPLVISNACQTNNFHYNTCFGEAMLRADNKGAIGFIGASDDTNWDEDFYWAVGFGSIIRNQTYEASGLGVYDRLFHDHGENESEWYVSQGQMISAGNLAVTESASIDVNLYWEIYHLMGDPSLMPYLSEPSALTVSHDSEINRGANQFYVKTEHNAYVALSYNDTLFGVAIADELGVALVDIPNGITSDSLLVVITKQNRKPYISIIPTVSIPYLSCIDFQINDSIGNVNSILEYGEHFSMNLLLKNTGNINLQNISVSLQSNDTLVEIIDSVISIGDLAMDSTIMLTGVFEVVVDSLVPNLHELELVLLMSDSLDEWDYYFWENIHSPEFMIEKQIIIDTNTNCNNNGRINAGESVELLVVYSNDGASAYNIESELSLVVNPGITITLANYSLDTFLSNAIDTAVFSIYASDTISVGSMYNFSVAINAKPYLYSENLRGIIGVVNEDFETGDFEKCNWDTNSSNLWVIDSVHKYEGTYCAKSDSIANDEKSVLSIKYYVLTDDSLSFYRKVSSEEDYDYLKFYIDDQLINEWSGVENWKRFVYHISEGEHTFKWVYQKDYNTNSNDDCAWVDFINFPPVVVTDNVLEENHGFDKKRGYLSNCYPNPVSSNSQIDYIVKGNKKASICIYNVYGLIIKEYPLSNTSGVIPVSATEFTSGIYFYSLIIEGSVIETKKMVVAY